MKVLCIGFLALAIVGCGSDVAPEGMAKVKIAFTGAGIGERSFDLSRRFARAAGEDVGILSVCELPFSKLIIFSHGEPQFPPIAIPISVQIDQSAWSAGSGPLGITAPSSSIVNVPMGLGRVFAYAGTFFDTSTCDYTGVNDQTYPVFGLSPLVEIVGNSTVVNIPVKASSTVFDINNVGPTGLKPVGSLFETIALTTPISTCASPPFIINLTSEGSAVRLYQEKSGSLGSTSFIGPVIPGLKYNIDLSCNGTHYYGNNFVPQIGAVNAASLF